MTSPEKLKRARRLRHAAEEIREHGFADFHKHAFACLRSEQVSKNRPEDRHGEPA